MYIEPKKRTRQREPASAIMKTMNTNMPCSPPKCRAKRDDSDVYHETERHNRAPNCRPTVPKTRTFKERDKLLSPTQSKYKFHGLMFPRNDILKHPAGNTLMGYAVNGCPVDCGADWSIRRIEAAISRGAHPLAKDARAAKACRDEALARAAEKCVRIISWRELKAKGVPKNLKVSPIAAIPHKSREFRMILDLAFALTINGVKLKSVNDTTNKTLAPDHSMFELGNVIPRIIWLLATAGEQWPFLMTKVDLKDGYWRLCVNKQDAWNFAYVLPKLSEHEETMLVIPDALQMG